MRSFNMKKIKVLVGLILVGITVGLTVGCGSATNNNQGASFQLGGVTNADGATTFFTMPYSVIANGEDGGTTSYNLVGTLDIRNNLEAQFITLQRAYLSYLVVGASDSVPDTSIALGSVVASKGTFSADIPVVPAQIRAWLSLHRASLPEAPFDLEVTISVKGVTSAGDTIETNESTVLVQVLPDDVINPPEEESAT